MQQSARDHARSYYLHKLAAALDRQGFQATVRSTYPCALHVFMPGASMLAESIDCVPGTDADGRLYWYYRWSWGEAAARCQRPAGRGGQDRRSPGRPLRTCSGGGVAVYGNRRPN